MANENRVWFYINPYEEEYLEKNGIEFSRFVHDSFYKSMKKDHYDTFNRLTSKISFILIGCILLALTYIIPPVIISNVIAWVIFFGIGIVFITIGFINIFFEVKNVRGKRRDH